LVEKEIDNHIVEIVFMLFFMLSAMHLDLNSLRTLPLAVMAYVLFRAIGKIGGAYAGARISHAEEKTARYLGMGLIPQAGVAIGLALSIQSNSLLEPLAPLVLNIIIATTLIHEFVGPFMSAYALKKSKNEPPRL
jgi:Kef-type K+ transport system membrane component KefB